MDKYLKEIQQQYYKVFEPNGKIKPCGRCECIELIYLCKEYEPATDFGNTESGFMNVTNIYDFARRHSLIK